MTQIPEILIAITEKIKDTLFSDSPYLLSQAIKEYSLGTEDQVFIIKQLALEEDESE